MFSMIDDKLIMKSVLFVFGFKSYFMAVSLYWFGDAISDF